MNILKTWKDLSPAKKASLALIFAKICEKGISMISAPIFTRLMVTEQYGEVTNYLSWESIIIIIATMNLSMGVFNNGMLDYPEDRDTFTASCLVLSNLCTIVVFGIYFISQAALGDFLKISNNLMILMFLNALFTPAYSFWACRQRYEFKYRLLTVFTIIIAAIQLVIGVLAVIYSPSKDQAVGKLIATETVLIGFGIGMCIYILYRAHSHIRWSYIKYAFKFNIFLIPHFLAISVLSSGDRVMINSMVGERATAIYGVSYSAANIIIIFWQAIEASWTPWLFENLKSSNIQAIKARANQITTLFATISIVAMLFAPEIMRILAPYEYQEGIYVIPSVTAGVFFTAVYALYMRIEYYSKKTKATMVGSVVAAIANIILNSIFIQKYGYVAAGYTTLVCYILLYLMHLLYTRHIGMKDIYNDKYIALISFSVGIVSVFIQLLYKISYIRYTVIIIIAVAIIIKRKAIVALIKDMIR